MKRTVSAVLVALMALVTSCAPQQDGKSPTRALIEYHRTGGIAGFDDLLLVDAAGKATLTRRSARQEFTVDPATLSQLRERFDKAGFGKLRAEYLPSGEGRDLFTYVVTYQGHAVRTMDTAVPEALGPILELLNRIVEKGARP